MDQHADTVPGFTMQSESFYLKFVTGLQCGVSSKLLEYETDWYEVMEILLSRLQDEPENKEKFEIIASRDLEYWARIQPGGDTLNLKIIVNLEEKRYFLPPIGSRKTLRLVFNDRFKTQVLFHARKKMLLKSLRYLAAIAVANQFNKEEGIEKLETEIPKSLIPDVKKAFHNCWTPRFFRTKIVACPPWCSCKTFRKPLANLEDKSMKTARRKLLYKRVAGKAVSKKAQKKQSVKKIDTKATLKAKDKLAAAKESKRENVKNLKKSKKAVKQVEKKKPMQPIKNSCKKVPVKSKKPTNLQKEGTKNKVTKKNPAVPKVTSQKSKIKANAQNNKSNQKPTLESKGKKPQSTPNAKNLKKSDVKKVDNVKVLKDKVKLMKKKLKTLLDTVAMKDKAILDIKEKFSTKKRKPEDTVDQVSTKRKSTRLSSTHAQKSNGILKENLKVETKSRKVSEENIFSPRPTRRSLKETPESKIKPKVGKLPKSKQPTDKSSPKSLPKSKRSTPKSKVKSVEPNVPKLALKRTRGQVHEAPTSKRRRAG